MTQGYGEHEAAGIAAGKVFPACIDTGTNFSREAALPTSIWLTIHAFAFTLSLRFQQSQSG